MKIKTKKSPKKAIIISLVALVILAGVATAYAYTQKVGPFEEKNFSTKKPTQSEKKTGESIKKSSIDNSSGDKVTTGSDPLPTPTPGDDGGKATVGIEITAANQNGAILNIRTLIQTVSSNGSCTLSMNGPNGSTYDATAAVQAMPSSTTCKGFDVPTADLMTGKWTITVTYENDEVTGSATKEVTIQ